MTAKNFRSLEYTAQPKKQINIKGVEYRHCKSHFVYDASEQAAGDTFVLAEGLDGNTIVKGVFITNSAITTAADNDVMICKHGETSAITVASGKINLLADGFTIASAATTDVLGSSVSGFDYSKSLAELTGIDNEIFDIVLTVKTAGTVDGTIVADVQTADNL